MIETVARRLIIIIVATGTAGVLVGVVVGRYAVPNNPKSPDTASVAPSAVSTASPAVTTPTATLVPNPQPSASSSAQTSDGGSQIAGVPTRTNEFGIPVGYPRDQAGAISACANYDRAWGVPANRVPSRIHDMFRSISLPSDADRIANTILEVDKKNAEYLKVNSLQSPSVNWIGRVIGYSVTSYNENTANIRLWGIVGFGVYDSSNPELAPREGWGTDDCQVVWNSGDWKLTDAKDGPWTPAITERTAESFRDFILVGAGQ
ncbi:hypothetical protein [Frankia sp. AiPa1]|uniref:hypothetical protein n=1 Tax=Frankia sp. AiPa1 TaxID=573492 RepID=UPI00202B018B|nr:hypothetical protein [Frankia sp. AiPa1]MCL9760738.1 hypothetical protein [Frankia sp. AiPa1]